MRPLCMSRFRRVQPIGPQVTGPPQSGDRIAARAPNGESARHGQTRIPYRREVTARWVRILFRMRRCDGKTPGTFLLAARGTFPG